MDGTPFGRYRLVEMLGRGGMGEVWKAYDTAMNRVVALKVLPSNLAGDAQYQARFRREAQAAASLDEPHIVPIHDFGEIDGRLYVTMRLIDGKTINELVADGPLPPARAVSIVEQIAAALGAAHRIGLVHRDVKPSNILVTEDDFAYLIDFGIARAADATKLTSTGATIGTLAYMAPERFTTDRDDARADIYALTCVLHECLTGSQPFPGDSLERQITNHLTMPPPRPSTMQPGISTQMDQVVAIGMAKNPDQRYATTKDLAVAARAALAGPVSHSAAAAVVPPPAPGWPAPVPYPDTGPSAHAASVAATQYGAPAQPATWSPPGIPQQPQSSSAWWQNPAVWILGGLAVAVVVIIAVVAVIIWPDGSSSDQPATGAQPTQQRLPSSAKPSQPTTNSTAPSATTSAPAQTQTAPVGPSQLQTADGLKGLLDTVRGHFGDTMGFQLVIYPEYAVLERVSPTNSHVEQDFMYRGGQWSSWGADTTTSSFDVLADLSAFSADAVAGLLAGAPQTLGAPDGSQTYLIVSGAEGGVLELAIHSASPGTGYMQVNPDGTIKKVFPP